MVKMLALKRVYRIQDTVQSKKSTAGLLGFGAEVNIKGRLLISPQLRYARWSNRPFSEFGFVSSQNSLDLLLSLRLGLLRKGSD